MPLLQVMPASPVVLPVPLFLSIRILPQPNKWPFICFVFLLGARYQSVGLPQCSFMALARDASGSAQSRALRGKAPAHVRLPLRKGPDWAWPPILLAWPPSKTHILSRSRDQEPFPAQAGPG